MQYIVLVQGAMKGLELSGFIFSQVLLRAATIRGFKLSISRGSVRNERSYLSEFGEHKSSTSDYLRADLGDRLEVCMHNCARLSRGVEAVGEESLQISVSVQNL